MMALLDIDLRAGDLDQARELLPKLFALNPDLRLRAVEMAWALLSGSFVRMWCTSIMSLASVPMRL